MVECAATQGFPAATRMSHGPAARAVAPRVALKANRKGTMFGNESSKYGVKLPDLTVRRFVY